LAPPRRCITACSRSSHRRAKDRAVDVHVAGEGHGACLWLPTREPQARPVFRRVGGEGSDDHASWTHGHARRAWPSSAAVPLSPTTLSLQAWLAPHRRHPGCSGMGVGMRGHGRIPASRRGGTDGGAWAGRRRCRGVMAWGNPLLCTRGLRLGAWRPLAPGAGTAAPPRWGRPGSASGSPHAHASWRQQVG
jgi:hypothetical protein